MVVVKGLTISLRGCQGRNYSRAPEMPGPFCSLWRDAAGSSRKFTAEGRAHVLSGCSWEAREPLGIGSVNPRQFGSRKQLKRKRPIACSEVDSTFEVRPGRSQSE